MSKLLTMFPTRISSSMLGALWGCETKWFRMYCQRLAENGSNPDLVAGGHFAKACEIVRKDYYNIGISVEDAVAHGVESILYGADTGHAIKTNERLAYALKRYFETFPLDNQMFKPAALIDGTYAIEYEFEFDMGIKHPELDQNIVFVGQLDAVYDKMSPTGVLERFVLDEKTSGQVSRLQGTKQVDYEKESNKHRMSGQFIAYAYAAKLLGVGVDAALVRVVPLLKEHENAFELRLPITNFMVEQWYNSTVSKIEEQIAKYVYYKSVVEPRGGVIQEAFYPTYQGSCQSWAKLCKYHEGCTSKYGEKLLEGRFEQLISVRQDDGSRKTISLLDFRNENGL